MKNYFLLILCTVFASTMAYANDNDVSRKTTYLSLRLPSLDFGLSAAVGTPIDQNHLIGISYYAGGLPMAGGGKNAAIFLRSFLIESIYIEGRAGYMRTTWGHPTSRSEAGASLGFHVGHQKFYESGFFHGLQWFGYDGYVEKGKGSGLPHFPAYELGFRF